MARSPEMGLEKQRGARAGGNLGEAELKRELRRLAGAIASGQEGDDDAAGIEALERASTVLSALRGIRLGVGRNGNGVGGSGNGKGPSGGPTEQQRKPSPAAETDAVPEHFLCPISSEIMKDPVVLATGETGSEDTMIHTQVDENSVTDKSGFEIRTEETYDRSFIESWLNAGHRTCPRTQQVLSHSILTPNHLLRRMVSEWCESHGVELPTPRYPQHHECDPDGGAVTRGERLQLGCLLDKISSPSVSDQKEAARELRLLTKRTPPFRALLGETPGSIPRLLALLSDVDLSRHPDLQEDLVTTLLNVSIHDSNKKLVGDNPQAIPLLVDALAAAGTMDARSNAAAALFTLSALDANKLRIGEMGAILPLVKLLEEGSPAAKKDAASAIFNLCMAHENRSRAVKEGAVPVLLGTVAEQTLVDESLAILAMLAGNQEAVEEMGSHGGVPCLLGIIRDSTCGRNRENSAVILYAVCINDRTKLREVREEEELHGTISQLAQNGTSRARRKAAGILDRMNRTRDVAYFSM
uniref:RING-type E3 ubiquitin transferase n=1 Tax=Anthurium amnicola TaxID=1678845 RepID=A0A1D1Y9W7_9ARAE